MKIGDLYLNEYKELCVVVDIITIMLGNNESTKRTFVKVEQIKTGNTMTICPSLLTKVETDNFCPLHSSSDLL